MKNWKQFNESLPEYNQYYVSEEKVEVCPSCGEDEDLQLLGPKDYKRDKHGDYRRTMGYRCNNCKMFHCPWLNIWFQKVGCNGRYTRRVFLWYACANHIMPLALLRPIILRG